MRVTATLTLTKLCAAGALCYLVCVGCGDDVVGVTTTTETTTTSPDSDGTTPATTGTSGDTTVPTTGEGSTETGGAPVECEGVYPLASPFFLSTDSPSTEMISIKDFCSTIPDHLRY